MSCCKDCEQRHMNCHAECPKWAEEQKKRKKEREERRKARQENYEFFNYQRVSCEGNLRKNLSETRRKKG